MSVRPSLIALDVGLSLQIDDGAIILLTYFGRMVASSMMFTK